MDYPLQPAISTELLYSSIRGCVVSAQHKIYASVNSAMVSPIGRLDGKFMKPAEKTTGRNMGKTCSVIFQTG